MSPSRLSRLQAVCFSLLLLLSSTAAFAAPPAAPTNLSVTPLSGGRIQLSWTDNSSDEVFFLAQYRPGKSGNWTSLNYFPANAPNQILNGPNAAVFQFQVCAVGASENSTFSNIAIVLTSYYNSSLPNQPFSTSSGNGTFTLAPSGVTGVTSFAATALPPGLSLNTSTGAITGTPTTLGTTNGTATITLADNSTLSTRLTLTIFKPLPPPAAPIVSTPLPARTLAAGSAPLAIPLESFVTDPDVSSAASLITDLGTMNLAFYQDAAPATVANFLGYAGRGDYNNTFFHRSVANFIVQGGAFKADATASAVTTQPAVVNEPLITNVRGTVAMAKQGGNPDSATNQFFVNLGDNSANLNNQNEGFTVFARVTGTGMSVADTIGGLPVKSYASVNGALTDTPVKVTPAPSAYDPAALVHVNSVSSIAPLSFSSESANPAIVAAAITGTTLTLSPATAGETTVNLIATDLDGQTVTASFPVTVAEGYESWAARQSFASPADAAATADPDGDGRLNFVEFALGSEPLVKAQNDPVPGLDNGSPTLTFQLRKNTTGVTVTLQKATDLNGPWTDEWTSTNGLTGPWISGTSDSTNVVIVTAKDPSPPAVGGREFLRLKISQ